MSTALSSRQRPGENRSRSKGREEGDDGNDVVLQSSSARRAVCWRDVES
jgi:hypothetical protein